MEVDYEIYEYYEEKSATRGPTSQATHLIRSVSSDDELLVLI